jgi:hypothetical protein
LLAEYVICASESGARLLFFKMLDPDPHIMNVARNPLYTMFVTALKKAALLRMLFISLSLWRKIKTANLPCELLLFTLRFLSLVLFEQLLRLYDAFPKIKNKNIFYLPTE